MAIMSHRRISPEMRALLLLFIITTKVRLCRRRQQTDIDYATVYAMVTRQRRTVGY